MSKYLPQPFLKKSSAKQSVLVGAPPEFDFLASLDRSVSIKAAIAFGHMTGWNEIDRAIRKSKARDVQLLFGQAFFQTEPDLLDLLLEAQKLSGPPRFRVKLAPFAPTFHPKVWIIKSTSSTEVIVGSANLSFGGFVSNTECSAYYCDPEVAASLNSWFEPLWESALPLTPERCRAYRQQHAKTIHARSRAKAAIQAASDELASMECDWKRNEAIELAKQYFSSEKGKASAKERVDAMNSIRRYLNPPSFNFTESDWLQFLRISEFGSLNRIPRDTAKSLPKIKKAFLYLADDSIPLEMRINDVVNQGGPMHVHRIGRNIATKVLAMLNPKTMPVYNEAVGDTLRSFGYPIDRDTTTGAEYEAFCKQMSSFVKECGQSEMLSIDAFFERYKRRAKN